MENKNGKAFLYLLPAILFAVQFRKALRGIENAAHNPK